MDFQTFFKLIEDKLAIGQSTGTNHSEAFLNYSKMNLSRMKRWMKTTELHPELMECIKAVNKEQHWIVITEGWCGDSAHSLPFIFKLSEQNPKIHLDIILRDENLELMDQYLTNGGRSIPKLIVRDSDGNDLFEWGPRPKPIQDYVQKAKAEGIDYQDYGKVVQQMYNEDRGVTIQKEFCELLSVSA